MKRKRPNERTVTITRKVPYRFRLRVNQEVWLPGVGSVRIVRFVNNLATVVHQRWNHDTSGFVNEYRDCKPSALRPDGNTTHWA